METLSGFRMALLQAARDRHPERLDSLRRAGDAEFGRRLWVTSDERVLLLLLSGRGGPLLGDRKLRDVLWGGTDEHTKWVYIPEFCPDLGYGRGMPVPNLGYAPDLIDHLHAWLAGDFENVAARLSPWPDLVEFLRLTRCAGGSRPWLDMDSLGRDFRARFPRSPFSGDIASFMPTEVEWSGNGGYFGGGPSYGLHDGRTAGLVSPGLQGGIFFAFHFPHLKLGMETQIRTFTARRAYEGADTVLPRGEETEFLRMAFTAGYSFRLGRNLFLTPSTGLLLSGLDWSPPEGKPQEREFHPRNLGWPVGLYLDWGFHPIITGNREIAALVGMRLSALYTYGRWKELEAGLGDQGLLAGVSVFVGLIGIEERK